MTEIQEQVEEFRQEFQPSPLTDMHGFDTFAKQYYDLLRKFLEECCAAIEREIEDLKEAISRTKGSEDDNDYIVLAGLILAQKKIRSHFAWLKK